MYAPLLKKQDALQYNKDATAVAPYSTIFIIFAIKKHLQSFNLLRKCLSGFVIFLRIGVKNTEVLNGWYQKNIIF